MGKVVDGVELLRMIRDEELVNGDKIKFGGEIFILNIEEREFYVKGKPGQKQYSLFQCWTVDNIFDFKFEILSEEDEEIDIDSIEEIDLFNNGIGFKDVYLVMRSYDSNFKKITDKYNELIKAVKQLNKKLEEK